MLIKICGVSSAETARAAVEAGADLVGFVFFPASPRHLTPAQAARIAESVGDGAETVAVFKHPDPRLVREVVSVVRPQWVQTDAEDFAAVTLPAGCRALPVYRPETLDHVAAGHALVLFEGPDSGRGEVTDWHMARELARRARLMLAGGLSCDNVAEAIEAVKPAGVDVSSGVESAPGVKDPQKIWDFVKAVRRLEDEG